MDTTDQPNSIVQLTTIENEQTILPFNLLAGETRSHYGTSNDGLILLTNYRLYIENGQYHHHIPLGLIEIVEHRELFYLHIGCKDARTYRCTFDNNENCLKWFDLISKAIEPPTQLNVIFAFYYFIYSKDQSDDVKEKIQNLKRYNFDKELFNSEMNRLGFKGDSWRISEANIEFKLCPTYPPYLIVPSCINDIKLESVAKFRSSKRIPAVVWRHLNNGAVIARCSQPEVGWLGWRSSEDEGLIQAISDACNFDQTIHHNNINTINYNNDKDTILLNTPGGSSSVSSDDSLQITDNITKNEKKVLIMDARSYTTAVANRARGGGCECPEYYPNCEIQFMNLANIHSIRKSFHAVRLLCTTAADQPNWFSQLENTRWLQHMSGLMKAAVTLVNTIEREARPVLVHCSDGWDRTSQIVALAELLLDPFYRTIDGFRILIEREWLGFGHKFADRCGHSPGSIDQNERCPVFLQWLDCIHQLIKQFPCAFEFSHAYLVKLAQHVYSNLYGTFLCNTYEERFNYVNGKTFSVWDFLNNSTFKNHLYAPPGNTCGNKVLWPQCNIRDLQLWNEVYLGTWEMNFYGTDYGIVNSCPGPPIISNNNNSNEIITTTMIPTTTISVTTSSSSASSTTTTTTSPQHMIKTRSYGDLLNDITITTLRRCSDPSINIDKKLLTTQEQQQQQQSQNIINLNGNTNNDCSRDCIYKNDEIDGHNDDDDDDDSDFLQEHVINSDKTDRNICYLKNGITTIINDNSVNNNNNNEYDSDNDCEKSESKSENTICYDLMLINKNSVETSTDTLVAGDTNINNISSSPIELNGFEKLKSPIIDDNNDGDIDDDVDDDDDNCKVCAQNLKFVNNTNIINNKDDNSCNNYDNISNRNSRTTSTSSWDNNYINYQQNSQQLQLKQHQQQHEQQNLWQTHFYNNLGDDGLVPVRSIAQERLMQIIQEHKRKEDLLEKELHTYRQALINQFCHKCSNNDDKIDDNFDSETDTSISLSPPSTPQRTLSSAIPIRGSVVESLCSLGEGPISAGGESIRSDLSWENLEENRLLPECTTTLWVPDHAVDRCMGCQTMFWAGRRKHHCRKCGNIFCASCSEHTTPLPSEQLFNPVRVCTGCYMKLHRDCTNNCSNCCNNSSNINIESQQQQQQQQQQQPQPQKTTQEQCKQLQQRQQHHHHPTANTNRQITASSN